MEPKQQIKEIILENNYFDTLAGQRFQEWNGVNRFRAVIAFAGRSKEFKSYELHNAASDSDAIYVTHLLLDYNDNILVQISQEDTDDFSVILRPNVEPIDDFDEDIIEEWVDLLTF